MIESWRWFGAMDSVSLTDIKQIGVKNIVTALHEIPCGEIWELERIQRQKQEIEKHGFTWNVVESLSVHEDIKKQTGDYKKYLEIYVQNMHSLAKCGIKTICYNFMPITDWTRTSLSYTLEDNTQTLYFDYIHYVLFDIFILQREGAANDYSEKIVKQATASFEQMDNAQKQQITKTVGFGLPGTVDDLSIEELKEKLQEYKHIDEPTLQRHLIDFLEYIMPHAKELDINMALHPDDPPFSLFGLPRIASTPTQIQTLFQALPSKQNGLTLCAGSLSARLDNNVVQIAKQFSDRIYFAHLRNTQNNGLSFYESPHLEGNVDMIDLISELLKIEKERQKQDKNWQLPFRPDHGVLMLDDLEQNTAQPSYPGYSTIGRMKGLCELRGAIKALERVG